MKTKLLTIILILLPFSTPFADMSVQEAQDILKPFKKELMKTLQGEMKNNGPLGGVKVCHLKAGPITQKFNKGEGILELGRTSHKLRNEKNAPRIWVQNYLEKFQKGDLKEPMIVSVKPGVSGYLEPIKVNSTCLKCHGTEIQPDVQKTLQKLYPKDQATGFKAGDFRGLFWIEMTNKRNQN